MQALYQADLAGAEMSVAIKNICESENFIPETISFATSLAETAWQKREETDAIISRLAIDWPLDRIGKVDRSVLRLALSELLQAETPASVIINEAVELAKKYSGDESAKFVNGILGTFVRAA